MHIRLCISLFFSCLCAMAQVQITTFHANGRLTWTNSQAASICHVEWAPTLTSSWSRSWADLQNILTSNAEVTVAVPMFYRVVAEPLLLTNGLALYLPFNGNTEDASPYQNDGLNSGATLAPDKDNHANRAYSFDGSGSQIVVNDTPSLDVSCITLAFWFNVRSHATVSELVNKFGGDGAISFGTEIQADHKIRWRISTNGQLSNLSDLSSTTTISPGVWYHFAGTYDGQQMTLYINGQKETTLSKTGAIFNSAEPLRIGRYGYYSWYFNGVIDAVGLWNRALTADEINCLYTIGYGL